MDPHRTVELALPPGTTRIVALGDPHGDVVSVERLLAEQGEGTLVLSVGDNVAAWDLEGSTRLCELLARRGLPSVRGNHDACLGEDGEMLLAPPELDARLPPGTAAFSRGLPRRLRLSGAGLALSVVHTLADWSYVSAEAAPTLLEEEQADLVMCGHSHRPAIYEVGPAGDVAVTAPGARVGAVSVSLRPGLRYVVDAGSVARPALAGGDEDPAWGSYAVLDLAARTVELRVFAKGRGR